MIQFINLLLLVILLPKKFLAEEFLFSVIISIYNTGRYLNDSIGSILKQTINPDKIQLILVNDGSTDETEKICLKYKEKYKGNVVYVKLEHGGVSRARNFGIQYAKGKYINFLDADDKWDNKAFKYVFLFFKMYKRVNIIACRLIFFEAKSGQHPLDYKFYKTRVVNLIKEYNCIQLSSSSSFFRHSFIKNKKFKEGIITGEDTRFINNLLLLNPFLGIISEAIYYYRKRADSTSTVQNQVKNEKFYFSVIKSVNHYLIKKSKKLYNSILPFIQFWLAYDVLFRISAPSYKYLELTKLKKYYLEIEKILNQIEDKYIIEQKILSFKEKIIALSIKHQYDLRNDIKFQNQLLIYSGHVLMNIKNNRNFLEWRILYIKNNIIHLEGKDNSILNPEKFFYFCKLGNKIYYPNYFIFPGYDLEILYKDFYKGRNVVFNIFLENKSFQIIQFFISYNDMEIEIFPYLGCFSHIPCISNGYYDSGEYIIKYVEDRLYIYRYDQKLKISFENQYCKELKKRRKNNIINLRKNYFEYENKNKYKDMKTWIINDKRNMAGDSGEYFFRFLKKINPKGINFYFVIKKDCVDYERLKSLGNILEYGSENYFILFLTANKIISSVSESWVDNPFRDDQKYVRDLIHFDYIFIQHGIIKDDLSESINRLNKNFNYIIISSNKEYESILDEKYGYNRSNILLSGLPIYDNLQNLQKSIIKEKLIIIIPTWRVYIQGTFNFNTYESIYSRSFILTDYFNFYNNLINNDQLLTTMKKLNYSGIVCLDPYFSKQWKDFKQNQIFSVFELCDYQKLILQASLLITDYSNLFFDFAYLKKPTIYTHFDYDEYRRKQNKKGYFDYKIHGFGPVCFNLECSIKKIISKLENNCNLEKKYLNRINEFFKYIDGKNCERLYLNLLNKSDNNNLKNYNKFKANIIRLKLLNTK